MDGARPDAPPLGGTEWTLVELAGASLELAEGERAPHLVFDLEESRVTGSGGCNRVTGTFALDEDVLRFGPLATTRMACPEPVMSREQAFLQALSVVTGYRVEDTTLLLLDGDTVCAAFTC